MGSPFALNTYNNFLSAEWKFAKPLLLAKLIFSVIGKFTQGLGKLLNNLKALK